MNNVNVFQAGHVYVNDAPASVFSQLNVDGEEVVYMQDNMDRENDTFTCTITNQVKPWVKLFLFF